MGKQINYYMEYESFVRIAEKALGSGCEIIRRDRDNGIVRGSSADIITRDNTMYFFHVPEAGIITPEEIKCIADGRAVFVNSIIEAGYSFISPEDKKIHRARLFCQTGRYDDKDVLTKRPECVTKIYNSLVRMVKKITAYTEMTDTYISTNEETYLKETEYRHKVYITEYCLGLKNKGYKLSL